MTRNWVLRTLTATGLLLTAVPLTHAAVVDTLTLTPSGTNTVFTVLGTFPADLPATYYSSPNQPYSLRFTLPTAPTNLALILPDPGLFVVDATVTLNAFTFSGSQVAFLGPAFGNEAFVVCLSEICAGGPPVATYKFGVATTKRLFTGDYANPVFISGAVTVDASQSFIESPVPEPSSLVLAGLGLGAVILSARRRWMRSAPACLAMRGDSSICRPKLRHS